MSFCQSSVRSRWAVFIGLVLAFILVIGRDLPAMAVGNLQLGPIELHPYFLISESYDDNVCRTEDKLCQDPKNANQTKSGKDLAAVFSPGLQIALPFQDHRFEAEYRGDWGRYAKFTTENYDDNALKGHLTLNFPGGLLVLLKEDWKAGHDPRGYAQNVQMDFYHQNIVGGGLELRVGPKLRATVNYTNLVLNYAADIRNGFRDRTDNTIGGTVYYKFLPKTSALMEYDYTAVSFDEKDPGPVGNANLRNIKLDNKVQRGYVGLTWNITARSQGTVKGGYTLKQFQNSGLNDFKGGIVSLGLNHELTARTSVSLVADRDVRESNLGSQSYYLSTNGRMELVHMIHPTVSAKLRAGFSRDQYPKANPLQTRKRVDDTWNAGLLLDYRLQRWLNLGLAYDRSERTSAIDGFGYIDNLYTFRIGALL